MWKLSRDETPDEMAETEFVPETAKTEGDRKAKKEKAMKYLVHYMRDKQFDVLPLAAMDGIRLSTKISNHMPAANISLIQNRKQQKKKRLKRQKEYIKLWMKPFTLP